MDTNNLTNAQKTALRTLKATAYSTAHFLGANPSALAALARRGLAERKWGEGSQRNDGRWSYRLSVRGISALRKIDREDTAEIGKAVAHTVTADHPAIVAAMARKRLNQATQPTALTPQRVMRRADGAKGTLREVTEYGWIVDMDHGTDVLGVAGAWELIDDTPIGPVCAACGDDQAMCAAPDAHHLVTTAERWNMTSTDSYHEEQRAELEAEQHAQTSGGLAHTHTVSTLNLREGDRFVGSGNDREVKSLERSTNNLASVLIYFTDGTYHHASTSDAWTINRTESYQAPTHHPGRCYCLRVGMGGHVPGLRPWGYYEKQCQGDAHEPHDPERCPACLAGATDLTI